MNGVGKMVEGRTWEFGLFVEEIEDSFALGLDQRQAVVVVGEANPLHLQTLALVQTLLLAQNAFVKKLLKLWAGFVYVCVCVCVYAYACV